ncbi:MAG TPA: tryptophan synthase subunit alpha [Gemmatimonadaceae bacterium]
MSATTSSERVAERFAQLRASGRRALVPYITAGHPSPAATMELLRGLEGAGADVIEIGVPFSDPMADGPIIQASSQKALANGMHFDGVLEIVSRARLGIPVILFTYLNPLLAAGRDALTRAAGAGLHGVLVVDLPVGADPEREQWLGEGPLAFIRLVAPTTPPQRMIEIAQHGSGFVYLISRLGVTGVRDQLPTELPETVRRVRQAIELPICVGFGVSRPEQARAVATLADGVVVGSAIVRAADESISSAVSLASSLRAAIDAVSP